MNVEDIEVRENENTRGYCADFTKNGHKYYADVSRVMFCGPECMIFAYDKDNKYIDWSGVYVNRDVDISKEALLQCIKEFVEQEYGTYEPTKEFLKFKEENLKLKQKLEAIRTTIVDVFDKSAKDGDADLYHDALIKIEKTIRECGQ